MVVAGGGGSGDGNAGAAFQELQSPTQAQLRGPWGPCGSAGRAMLYTVRHHGPQNQTVTSDMNPKSKIEWAGF